MILSSCTPLASRLRLAQSTLYRHTSRAVKTIRMSSVSNSHQPIVIAIDGPAASGKGTLAKQLASTFSLAHLDTGLLYRAVGYKALQLRIPLNDTQQVAKLAEDLTVDDVVPSPENLKMLRCESTGSAASQVSVLPEVRAAIGAFPRNFVARLPPGVKGSVIDGRDVGTVLFPDAPLKLFLIASAEVRAQRRLQELRQLGDHSTTYESVLQAVQERDRRDTGRSNAPLIPAQDAVQLDTSTMTAESVYQKALQLVKERLPSLQASSA